MSSANRQFCFHFFILDIFISFSCLTALARTSSIMLNISSDNGHLCLILNLRKIFKPFTIKYYVSSGLVIRSLYYVEIHVFIYLKKKIYFFLFLAVLILHFCGLAFSSCGEWELLCSCSAKASHCSGFSYCSTQG